VSARHWIPPRLFALLSTGLVFLPLAGCGESGLETKIKNYVLACFNKTQFMFVAQTKNVSASISQTEAERDDQMNGYTYRGTVTVKADQQNENTHDWKPGGAEYLIAVKNDQLMFLDGTDLGCRDIAVGQLN